MPTPIYQSPQFDGLVQASWLSSDGRVWCICQVEAFEVYERRIKALEDELAKTLDELLTRGELLDYGVSDLRHFARLTGLRGLQLGGKPSHIEEESEDEMEDNSD